jgi:curved DNA-binding protein CbpA
MHIFDAANKLGLVYTATVSEVRRAYRHLAIRKHPDKSTSPTAKEDFQMLAEAYDCLLRRAQKAEKIQEQAARKAACRAEAKAPPPPPPLPPPPLLLRQLPPMGIEPPLSAPPSPPPSPPSDMSIEELVQLTLHGKDERFSSKCDVDGIVEVFEGWDIYDLETLAATLESSFRELQASMANVAARSLFRLAQGDTCRYYECGCGVRVGTAAVRNAIGYSARRWLLSSLHAGGYTSRRWPLHAGCSTIAEYNTRVYRSY